MRTEQASPENKGVTVKQLAAIDLGPEIEGMAGRQLRMRMVTIEPGGVIGPVHNHIDRPGVVYILQEWPGSTVREWAGPRIRTPLTGLRTEVQQQRWKYRLIFSISIKPGTGVFTPYTHLCSASGPSAESLAEAEALRSEL